jgi:muramoyltetrapeptide carboxypeptidase
MFAPKLDKGDEIRVIAPSFSLAVVWTEKYKRALSYLEGQGFKVTFSKHSRELDDWRSSGIASRVEDIHEAFIDDNVKAILTAIGGFNVNQILEYIDYDIIKRHPKVLCGYSDITALLHAVYTKTGLVTYHGVHFSTFGFEIEEEYTQRAFLDCVMNDGIIKIQPSQTAGRYTVIQYGSCEGTIIGGNLCTLNLLQGTQFMPQSENTVLFIEDDNIMGDYFKYEFDRNLQSLLQAYGTDKIKGVVFGRFDGSCNITTDIIRKLISDKLPKEIPVLFGVDFGHVFPMITFPIGGKIRINAINTPTIEIINH